MRTRTRKSRKSFKITKKYAIIGLIVFSLFVGFLIGIFSSKTIGQDSFVTLKENIEFYLRGLNTNELNKMDMFKESVFKYCKLVVIIWLLAFVPAGGFAIFIILMAKGAAYGFTTTLLIHMYGVGGILSGALLYFPQSLILIPAYFFVSYSSIHFILFNIGSSRGKKPIDVKEYLMPLLMGNMCAVLAGFIDAFIVPTLIQKIL